MKEQIYFSKEDVLAIHSASIVKFGGSYGISDEGLLESALAQPFQTFDGIDLYPDAIAKACRYAYGIINDHPFVDGNKRTGTALLAVYLKMAGIEFKPQHDELLETMLAVARGDLSFEELVSWVRSITGHSVL